MTLHDWIMGHMPDDLTNEADEFYDGFAESSLKAANLATEADELMAEMVQFVIDCDLSNNTDIREAHRILDKYNAYKEQSNEQ